MKEEYKKTIGIFLVLMGAALSVVMFFILLGRVILFGHV